jgi:hypothetical protein
LSLVSSPWSSIKLILALAVASWLVFPKPCIALENLRPNLQTECSLLDDTPQKSIPLSSDRQPPCRFRVVATPPQSRPFVYATILTSKPGSGKIRDRLTIAAAETADNTKVATPWVSLCESFWKDAGVPSVRGVLGDDLFIFVGFGAQKPTVLRARVGPPKEFSPTLRAPLSLRVVSKTSIASSQRRAYNQILERHLDWTNEVLGQCGISVDTEEPGSMAYVEAPKQTFVSLGSELGILPTELEVSIEDEGRLFSRFGLAGMRIPLLAAQNLAAFLETQGLSCRVIENSPRPSRAHSGADLSCIRADGTPARLRIEAQPPFADIMTAEVVLGDGLTCYTQDLGSSGSPEQRALILGLWPSPPGISRLIIVDKLLCLQQLAQSFSDDPKSPLFGAMIIDRRGLARGREVFALAHELGHVLLSTPGHPEDDEPFDPELLMNSQSSSIYAGPRRIPAPLCELMRRSPLLRAVQR